MDSLSDFPPSDAPTLMPPQTLPLMEFERLPATVMPGSFDAARGHPESGHPPPASASVTLYHLQRDAAVKTIESILDRRLTFAQTVPDEVIQRIAGLLSTPRWIMDHRRREVFLHFLAALDPETYDRPTVREAKDDAVDDLFIASLGLVRPELSKRFSELRSTVEERLDPDRYGKSVTERLSGLIARRPPPPRKP